MTKVEIDSENVIKAHKEGCSDVKKVLENLFPATLKPPAPKFEPKQVWKVDDNYIIILADGNYMYTSNFRSWPIKGAIDLQYNKLEYVRRNIQHAIELGHSLNMIFKR